MSQEQMRKTEGGVNEIPPVENLGPGVGSLPLSPEVEKILARLLAVQGELDSRKALYEELNALTMELVRLGFVSTERGGEVITLKDNFAHSNTGWTSAGVRRFEVEVISKELAEKRAKRGKK